jgi:hypothetical protein
MELGTQSLNGCCTARVRGTFHGYVGHYAMWGLQQKTGMGCATYKANKNVLNR